MRAFVERYMILQQKRFDKKAYDACNKGRCLDMSGAERRAALNKAKSKRNQELEKEFANLFSQASDEELWALAEYEKAEGKFLQELKNIFSVMKEIRKSAQDKLSGRKYENYFRFQKKKKKTPV